MGKLLCSEPKTLMAASWRMKATAIVVMRGVICSCLRPRGRKATSSTTIPTRPAPSMAPINTTQMGSTPNCDMAVSTSVSPTYEPIIATSPCARCNRFRTPKDQGIAYGNQGITAAQHQPINELLDECRQHVLYSPMTCLTLPCTSYLSDRPWRLRRGVPGPSWAATCSTNAGYVTCRDRHQCCQP